MAWKNANQDMISIIRKEPTYSERKLNDIITQYQGKTLFFRLCQYHDKCAVVTSDEEIYKRHGEYQPWLRSR